MLSLSRAAVRLVALQTALCGVFALACLLLPCSAFATQTATVNVGAGCTLPSGTTFSLKAFAVNGGHLKSATATAPGNTTYAAKSMDALSPEVYTISAKGSKWLRKNDTVDLRSGDGSVSLTLLGGDANNNNVVDIADLLILMAHYNQPRWINNQPNSDYLDSCDFNCDDVIDTADLLLLVGNYNKVGDPEPIPPLSAFSLNTSETFGGNEVQATITLTAAAPSGGKSVLLRSTPENAFRVRGTTDNTVAFAQNDQTKTVSLDTSTVTHETHLLVIADCEGSTISENVVLKPVTLRITKITDGKITLEWPAVTGATSYQLVRTVDSNTPTTISGINTTTYEDSVSWTTGATYKYELSKVVSNSPTYLATEKARFFITDVGENQAVDSRQDPRNSETTYVDFKFGNSVYKGGLFTGYAKRSNDQSKTGRSLLKFTLPSSTNSQFNSMAFRTGSVSAYFVDFERRNANPNSAVIASAPFDIYCQVTDSSWQPSTVKWTNAPPLNTILTTEQIRKWKPATTNDKGIWGTWEMSQGIIGAMRASNHDLGILLHGEPVGTIGTESENGYGWAYFAKKEYDNSKAARVLHAWTFPTPYTIEPAAGATGKHIIHVTLNGLGIGDAPVEVHYRIKYTSPGSDPGPSDDLVVWKPSATGFDTAKVDALRRYLLDPTTLDCIQFDHPSSGLGTWFMEITVECNGVSLTTTSPLP